MHGAGGNNNDFRSNDSQITAVISVINNKQSEIESSEKSFVKQLSPGFQMNGSQFKTQQVQKSSKLNEMITDHTPERRESNLSMD